MDKRANKILALCLICSCIVGILFFVLIQYTRNSCELVFINTNHLRSAALSDWPKSRPLRSHDKSTLIKFSAYLEYNLASNPSSEASKSDANLVSIRLPRQPAGSAPASQGAGQAPVQGAHPTPAMPVANFTSAQLQNSTIQSLRLDGANSSSWLPLAEEKRYLPLELTDFEMEKRGEDKFKYTLTFNCSVITIVMRRRADRVQVEEMGVELKVESKRKSKCDIDMNGRPLFSAPITEGLAHYHCDRQIRLNCTHYSSKSRHTNQAGTLLGQLVINGIEFETGTNTSPIVHQKKEFLGVRKDCDPTEF